MAALNRTWTVLLIGGPSGSGKTTVARDLGLRFGVSWLQVDDLRLALHWSRATLPDARATEALYFFLDTPNVWRLPPERLRDALIAVGEAMTPAIEIVVANHVATDAPVVIEGDAILPSLVARPELRPLVATGRVRAVFLDEPDEAELYEGMIARGRGIAGRSQEGLRTEARAKRLHGHWLADEAKRHGVPVLTVRPWDSLVERVAAAAEHPIQSPPAGLQPPTTWRD